MQRNAVLQPTDSFLSMLAIKTARANARVRDRGTARESSRELERDRENDTQGKREWERVSVIHWTLRPDFSRMAASFSFSFPTPPINMKQNNAGYAKVTNSNCYFGNRVMHF
jgi:hypothetical protein